MSAKEDTVFVSGASVHEDDSQYQTDLTVSGDGAYEASSTRGAITGETGREIYVRFTRDAAEGVLAAHADVTTSTWAIGLDDSYYLNLSQDGAELWSAGYTPYYDHRVSWSTRPNPDATGASDALLSDVLLVIEDNYGGQTVEFDTFTHSIPDTDDLPLSIGGVLDGGVLKSTVGATATPTVVRVSKTYHPPVEFFEDWIGARPAYGGSLDDGIAEPLPVTVASGLGDTPEFVGRANAGFAAAHSRAVERRTWSPLVNECYRAAPSVTTTLARHLLTMPGSTLYQSSVFFLRWVPVPPGATHAWVRVQVQSWVTSGAAVPVGVRCYALNRPPTVALGGLQNQPAPPLDVAYRGQVITVDHGASGTGEWLDLGLVRLPVFDAPISGWRDTVHLCLAYAIDPANASTNDTAARLKIHAWNVQPVQQWTPGGLFGG